MRPGMRLAGFVIILFDCHYAFTPPKVVKYLWQRNWIIVLHLILH